MIPSWTVRTAEAPDAAAIAGLIRLAFATQSRPTHPPPSALKETADTVRTHLGEGGGAVIDDGGMIVGAVLWNEDEGGLYIGRLSVHPDHRRRGIASALIREAEREARRQGLTRLCLGVRLVLDDNRRFFAGHGFKETTLHRHEGFTEPTWVTMERELPTDRAHTTPDLNRTRRNASTPALCAHSTPWRCGGVSGRKGARSPRLD